MKLQNVQTYNPYKFELTTCYHSLLPGTIQFGVLQKRGVGHGPYYYFY